MAEVKALDEKIRTLTRELRQVGIHVTHDVPKWAYLQGVLARGDRQVGDLLLLALASQGRLAAGVPGVAAEPRLLRLPGAAAVGAISVGPFRRRDEARAAGDRVPAGHGARARADDPVEGGSGMTHASVRQTDGTTVVQSAILEVAGRHRPRLQHPAGRGESAAVRHAQSGPERGGRSGGGGGESAAVLRRLRHRRGARGPGSSRSHGDGVLRVDAGARPDAPASHVACWTNGPKFDALITNLPGLALVVSTADCLPILIHDPVRGAVAAVHAGWRGTAKRIAARALAAMREAYGTDPADCRAAIGPGIRGCCFEVDAAVTGGDGGRPAELGDARRRRTGPATGCWISPGSIGRSWRRPGFAPTGSRTSGLCTSCRNDLFFSHRAEKGRTGRMMNFILLKERRGPTGTAIAARNRTGKGLTQTGVRCRVSLSPRGRRPC